jgi:hypothetical protein
MRALFSLRVLERRSKEKGALCSLFGQKEERRGGNPFTLNQPQSQRSARHTRSPTETSQHVETASGTQKLSKVSLGQPTRRINTMPSYAPHALCLSTADVRILLKTTDESHEPVTPRARHASARACMNSPRASNKWAFDSIRPVRPGSHWATPKGMQGWAPCMQIKWTS